MKEVGDSVHTGEKNLMPSMLKRRVGKNTVASVDGECSRVRTETSRHSSATKNKLEKSAIPRPVKRIRERKNTRDMGEKKRKRSNKRINQ